MAHFTATTQWEKTDCKSSRRGVIRCQRLDMKKFYLLFATLLLSVCAHAVLSSHTVSLTWDLSQSDIPITRQQIWRQINCTGPYVRKVQLGPTAVQWEDTRVMAGFTYCYYIVAIDDTGLVSEPSNVVTVTLPEEGQ